jgi:tetratricopeptide (TPR) repeat protein
VNEGYTFEVKLMKCEVAPFSVHVDLSVWSRLREAANLAASLAGQGDHKGAEVVCREALKIPGRALEPFPQDVVVCKVRLAQALQAQDTPSKLREAALYYRQVEEGMTPDLLWRQDILEALTEYGKLLFDMGQYKMAEGVLAIALQGLLALLSPDHPSTVDCASTRLMSLLCQEEDGDANKIVDMVPKAGALHFSPQDNLPSVFRLAKVAAVKHQQGKYLEAEGLLRNVLPLITQQVGLDHPRTLDAMAKLGMALCEQSGDDHSSAKYSEGVELLTKVFETRLEVLGPHHPATVASQHYVEMVE